MSVAGRAIGRSCSLIRVPEARPLLAVALVLAWLGACDSGKTADPESMGGLVVVVETDLALPQDIDRIRIEVTQQGRVLLSEDHMVGPGHLLVPAEFKVAPVGNAMPVTARGVAFKDGEPRIERSAVTPIPATHMAHLHLPLNYLCDGTATREGTSTCGEAQTCKQGSCRTSMVAPAELPPTETPAMPGYADGGIVVQTASGCFDVLACFAGAMAVEVEEVTCSVAMPPDAIPGRLNVGIQLPLGGAGICNEKGCWVAIDRGEEGWALEGARLRLPEGLCRPRVDGRKPVVVVSTSCASKVVTTPPCGPWSTAMTPIESPAPPPLLGEACVGPTSQGCGNCGTQTRQCQNGKWSGWSECSGQGPCEPTSSQACGMSGDQICGGDCRWGMCTGQRCSGVGSQACGNCGTQTRTCSNGTWSEWSACGGEGLCAPNATRTCEANGTQSCGGSCQWGGCIDKKCEGPPARACGNCGTQTRTCDSATGTWSGWSACLGEGVCTPNSTTPCAGGGMRTCGGSCQWSAACSEMMCSGPSGEVCGNCGMRTRACDTNTGTWSEWSACSNEGACMPGATQMCGMGGTESCGATCQWGSCEDQECAGAPMRSCGNCGQQSRTCNNGVWSDWTTCANQGVCAIGMTAACGAGGRQACGGTCQWSECFEACRTNNGGCDPLTTCTNTGVSRTCGACPGGHTGTGDTGCVDIDECAMNNGGCDPLTTCTNTAGSRTCGLCPMGHVDVGAMGATACMDIDECATNNGGCDPLTTCTNTPGSRTCGACPMGYAGTGATGCMDVDECATNNGGCDPLTTCTNTPGSRTCGECPAGYTGSGAMGCTDINECAINNGGCSTNATCSNTPGSRTCACHSGFTGDGFTCAPARPQFIQVTAGMQHSCGVLVDGQVRCWGSNASGQSAPPGGTFNQISAADAHTCGVRSEGTVACWGANSAGQSTAPEGSFLRVSAGGRHTCGLRVDGTVACWGETGGGRSTPPAGVFVDVSAGSDHTCGVRVDGTLACWGTGGHGQATPPSGNNYVQVASGALHSCARSSSGTVVCWGDNTWGESSPPPHSFTQITSGWNQMCGVRLDQSLACWGLNTSGGLAPPSGAFIQVAMGKGGSHACAVRVGGLAACWGFDTDGQLRAP